MIRSAFNKAAVAGLSALRSKTYPAMKIHLATILVIILNTAAVSQANGERALPAFDAGKLGWSHLSFEASKTGTTTTSKISLQSVTLQEAKRHWFEPAGATGRMPQATSVWALEIDTTLKGPFVNKYWEGRVWLDPADATALQRWRRKHKADGNKKIYRYAAQGVHRQRLEPKDKKEANKPPEQWSDKKHTFYAYPPAVSDCPLVTDPTALLILASTEDLSIGQEPLNVCVFNKKTVYRVQMRAVASESLRVAYRQRSAQGEARRDKEVLAVKVKLSARLMDPNAPDVEVFEFLGLEGDIAIHLDPDTRIPLQVSGTISGAGQGSLRMTEVTLR